MEIPNFIKYEKSLEEGEGEWNQSMMGMLREF